MKPIHAKPQSGRAIEPGLVLRIVSKRGRTVMFGQTGLLFANRQWGDSTHGWVSFPIMFTSYRLIITNHQGNAFYDSKPRESDTLGGFTLDVGSNNDVSMDAYWIAIGL